MFKSMIAKSVAIVAAAVLVAAFAVLSTSAMPEANAKSLVVLPHELAQHMELGLDGGRPFRVYFSVRTPSKATGIWTTAIFAPTQIRVRD